MEIRAAASTVEVFHRGVRVASHRRSHVSHRFTTTPEHRPKSHQRYLGWTPLRLIEWARKIGPATAEVVERILAGNHHPEQGYRSCLGIIRLGDQYPKPRVEAASQKLLQAQSVPKHMPYMSPRAFRVNTPAPSAKTNSSAIALYL